MIEEDDGTVGEVVLLPWGDGEDIDLKLRVED